MSQLTFLNEREHKTIDKIGDVLYPEGGTIPYSARQVGVCDYVDDYVFDLPKKHQTLVRMLFLLLEFLPLLLFRSKNRLSRMSVDEATDFMKWLEQSPIYYLRIVLISIRTIIGMAFMADERVLKAMGYFKTCSYPGDQRNLPTWKEVEGAGATLPQEVRDAG